MSGFIIAAKLHNRRTGGGAKEQGAVVRLTATDSRFTIYKRATEILGNLTKGDFVGIITGQIDENSPVKAYIFQGDAGTKGDDGKAVQPAVGSQLSAIQSSDNAFAFSMGAAYKELKEMYGAEFLTGKKGGIKFVVAEEAATTFEEYEGMKNVQLFELVPVKVEEDEEEEEDEDAPASNDSEASNDTEGLLVSAE